MRTQTLRADTTQAERITTLASRESHYQAAATIAGMTFVLMSRYERAVTWSGRHFVATGSNQRGYTLFEHDVSLPEAGRARCIGRGPRRIAGTAALVAEIRRLVDAGEQLPADPMLACVPHVRADEMGIGTTAPVPAGVDATGG